MEWSAFIGGSATTQSLILGSERLVNGYIERAQSPGARHGAAIYSSPGFAQWAPAVATFGGRGAIVAAGRVFFVIGSGLYEYDSNGVSTLRGTVATDAYPARLVYNGQVAGQLGIASGGNAYCLTLATNAFAQVLTGDCTMLATVNGYGLAFDITTGRVRLSALNDITTWPGAVFFQRSLFPDPWQTMLVDQNGLIWLIGTESYEAWYFATAASTQPFAPLLGVQDRIGIAAPFAFGLCSAGLFWLAQTPEGIGRVVKVSGSKPETVSTYAVNAAIARYRRGPGIGDAEMLIYEQEGHLFVNVNFQAAQATWTYDTDGGGDAWAERGTWNAARGDYDVWSPRCHVAAYGRNLVADRATGQISSMDVTLYTEINGAGIRRLRRAPIPMQEHQRQAIEQIEFLADVGVGLQSGQGSAPAVLLRLSPDGGNTWGNEHTAALGAAGQYGTRLIYRRLGAPANPVAEVTYSDPTPFRIVSAWINNQEP